LLKGLPDDRCQCPHWGYLLAGRLRVRYASHEEIVNLGEVYYMAPGHTMAAEAGTVLIEFSPKKDFERSPRRSWRRWADEWWHLLLPGKSCDPAHQLNDVHGLLQRGPRRNVHLKAH
jgi:hypothetical protein